MRAIQKGFTLVELLVVAIIIGILSSLALSAYSKHKENAIRARIFAAVEGWNQVHSAYLSRNLMPPGSRLSNLESPSEAASEVFLVLKPYIPSVRNYTSLSDFEYSVAEDIGLEENPYKIIYAKKNNRVWQFMAVGRDEAETPNEAEPPEVAPEIPPYNDYIPSITDPVAQLPDIVLPPAEEPSEPITPPDGDEEEPEPEKEHTAVSLYAGTYTVDIYVNPNNTQLSDLTQTINLGIVGSCELCPASKYVWRCESNGGSASVSLSGGGNGVTATISFSALPEDSDTGSFTVYCKIGDGHPCEFGNELFATISYNIIIGDMAENEGGVDLDTEYTVTCDIALMPPIEYTNVVSDTYAPGDLTTSNIWAGVTTTEFEYARPLLRIKLASENTETPVRDNFSKFYALMGRSIDLSWLNYTGKIYGRECTGVSNELSSKTSQIFSIGTAPVTYRNSSNKETAIAEVKYGQIVGLSENCVYILPSDPAGDGDVWSWGDYDEMLRDIPKWSVYRIRDNIDLSGYNPQTTTYLIVEGESTGTQNAHRWWSTTTTSEITNQNLGTAEYFKFIRALNPYTYQFLFWGEEQFAIFSENGDPFGFATQISGVGYDLGYAVDYLMSYISGTVQNHRGLTEDAAAEFLNDYLSFIDAYFNGTVSLPYLITLYGAYSWDTTQRQIAMLKEKILNYIETHALY